MIWKEMAMSKQHRWITALMIVAMAATSGGAQDLIEDSDSDQKLVLVLSGGGARGAAHVGVLRVLEELHIAPDLIVGTSMGSIVGGLYSAGWSPDEIEELVASMDWNAIFSDVVPRGKESYRRKQDDRPILVKARLYFKGWKPFLPAGILGGQRLELLMDAIQTESASAARLDELNIPFRAVAADIVTGQPVVIDNASLGTAMRASMSIPGAFSPVELDGHKLVDGGSVANLPVGIAKQLGATSIIAVDISSPLIADEDDLESFFSVFNQLNSLLTVGNRDRDVALLDDNDLLIQPDLGDISFVAFDRALEAVGIGEATARAMTDQLTQYATEDDERWEAYITRQRQRPREPITIERVRIENTAPISDTIVGRALSLDPPATYEPTSVLDELMQLHSLRYFGIIDFRLEGEGDDRELVISTPPRPSGRGSVQFGIGFSDDFSGNIGYTVSARHQLLAVNRRGGEWENILQLGTNGLLKTEFFQPLDPKMRWFVAPSASFRRELVELWSDGQPVVEYELERIGARLSAGRILGRWGEARVGIFTADYKATPRIGDPSFPSDDERRGGLAVGFRVDTVDTVAFPTKGTEAEALYTSALDGLGAEKSFERAALRVGHSFSFGKNTITPYLEYGENAETTANYLDLFKLGGIGRLSGLGDRELLGEKLAFGRLLYYHRITNVHAAGFSVRVFGGASLEAGNVYDKAEAITGSSLLTAWSLFVGADTPLGPLFLGYGRSEDRGRFYLAIGDHF
jgi:NTE family protein